MGSNDISNRKDARNSLVTALQTITGFQVVFDHLPKDAGGQTPFCCVDSMGQYPQFLGSAVAETFQFAVGVWIKRGSAGDSISAETVEDTLDDLAQDVAEVVQDWHNGIFYQAAECDYETLDDGTYRVEWHYVQVDWE